MSCPWYFGQYVPKKLTYTSEAVEPRPPAEESGPRTLLRKIRELLQLSRLKFNRTARSRVIRNIISTAI